MAEASLVRTGEPPADRDDFAATAGLATASTGPLRCPTCSTPTVANARFCHVCGMPLTTERVDESAERRVVTVLFGDLSDFTAWAEDLDPERVGEVTDRVLAALARVVVEVGGHVDKLTGDGIMAVFGAPTAHEDDAERAVRAAVNMQHEVEPAHRRRARRRPPARAAGRAQHRRGAGRRAGGARLHGRRRHGEHRLAAVRRRVRRVDLRRPRHRRRDDDARLMARACPAAAQGQARAGRGVRAGGAAPDERRPAGPRRRGALRRPRGRGRPRWSEPASTSPSSGSPATLYVSGEAGVGKTRTVGELARFAGELPDGRVLWGRAMPYGEGRHLAPLVELVRTACGITDERRA